MTRFLAFAALVLPVLGCVRQPEEETVRSELAVAISEPEAVKLPEVPVAPMPRTIDRKVPVAPMPHSPGELDLTNEDLGCDDLVIPLNEVENLPDVVVVPGITPNDLIGPAPESKPDEKSDLPQGAFTGRSGETKAKLIKEGGANEASEQAVALGLAWLAKQQKTDGGWEYDRGNKEKRAAATGMALLAFLGAGETHKNEKGKYRDVVKKGLGFLVKMCALKGANPGRMSMLSYEQAIATLALCEAYGMTKDPALKPYAQAAVNYIQKAQGPNGSWGYAAGTNGDTSIVGWEIQALFTAKMAKDLVVNEKVLKNASKFLDFVSAGEEKAMYGYADNKAAHPGNALTASGLLSRSSIDAWGPKHPGMIEGVTGLLKNSPVGKGQIKNLYYYYYATQVVHFFDGEEWKTWNLGSKAADGSRKEGMRDWLVSEQVQKEGENRGSWNPEGGFIGTSCGRLGTTAMCILTLEVYYRHLPPSKDADGKGDKIPEAK